MNRSCLAQCSCRRHEQGFTLVELMVTLTVLAILMSMAVPSFSRLIAANRLAMQTNEFVASLNLARTEAVRRTQTVSLASASAGTDYQSGWTVFLDSDSNGAMASSTDAIRVMQGLAGTTTVTRVKRSGSSYVVSDDSDSAFIAFNSRGAKAVGGTAFFKICDSGNTAIPGRVVRVLTAGTVSLVSATESCS